jgi:hypothetical protein
MMHLEGIYVKKDKDKATDCYIRGIVKNNVGVYKTIPVQLSIMNCAKSLTISSIAFLVSSSLDTSHLMYTMVSLSSLFSPFWFKSDLHPAT